MNASTASAIVENVAAAGRKIGSIFSFFNERKRLEEEGKTQRAQIRSYTSIEIERVRAQKEVMLNYFEHAYSERAIVLKESFARLDHGIASGSDAEVSFAMNTILTTVQNSPLREIRSVIEEVKKPGKDLMPIKI